VQSTDTALVAELDRKQVSVRDYTSKVSSFTTYFNTSEANDTLLEIGLFGDDASSITDSGTMFARLVINKTKTSSETLTVIWEITFSST